MPVPNATFEELIRTGRLTGLVGASPPPKYEEGRELLAQASPAALEEANRRYTIIAESQAGGTTEAPARTIRRWKAQFQDAVVSYGNGLIGLLPQKNLRGNRRSRLDPRTEELIERFITEQYETLKQQSKKAVYLELSLGAERLEIPVPTGLGHESTQSVPNGDDQSRRTGSPQSALRWRLLLPLASDDPQGNIQEGGSGSIMSTAMPRPWVIRR
jgi:hypothetical protein